MSRKPLPTMLDGDINPTFGQFKMVPEVTSALEFASRARRYVFDQEASRHVGVMLRENLDLLIDNIEFARAPMLDTYIELDYPALWHAWRPELPRKPAETDTRIGFLVHLDNVISLATGPVWEANNHVKGALIAPWSFRVNRVQRSLARVLDQEDERALLFAKMSYVLGVTKGKHPGEVDIPYLKNFNIHHWSPAQVSAHFDMYPTYDMTSYERAPKLMLESCFQGSGDPVILTAALLLLGQPRHVVSVETRPAFRQVIRGREKWVHEHHRIIVHLDPTIELKRDRNPSPREGPEGHIVEGHWRNYNKPPAGCDHDMEPVGQERSADGQYKRYWCPKCLQRRTRVDQHLRGDWSRGGGTSDVDVRR